MILKLFVMSTGLLAGSVLGVINPPTADAISAWRVAITAMVVAAGSVSMVAIGQAAAAKIAWDRLGLNVPLRRVTDRPVVAATVAAAAATGGGPVVVAPSPLSVPPWNQQTDPNPDGTRDAYWYEDCGEQCVAMIAYACRGVEVPEGVVRMQMHGIGGRGLSSADDLVTQLRRWHFNALRKQLSADEALAYLRQAVAGGRPVAALGHWLSPSLLHWIVVVEITPDGVTFNDPWYGNRRGLSLAHWGSMFTSDLVDPQEAVRY